MLSTERCLEAIRTHGLALADAAEGNLNAEVVKCPGWTVADLVWHVRGVHYFWGSMVDGLLADPDAVPDLERPGDDAQLLADYRRGANWLVHVLGNADQAAPIWTWSHQKDVAFVTRHQVQEAAVHRWDAEMAAGREFGIEPEIAADSVDEFLEHSTPGRNKDAAPLGGSVHLHATDVDGEWVIKEDESGKLSIVQGHERADAALRASASNLLLMLYRRESADRGEIHGDPGVIDRFLARTNLD
jgi:uncharacterized protein (TIGR03083 family)